MSSIPPLQWCTRRFRKARHAVPASAAQLVRRRTPIVAIVLAFAAVVAPAAVWAGTAGSDPNNGSWAGGKVFPGPEPLVLWNLPGSGGKQGTCIDANVNGPLRGPYSLTATITDPVYGELNHLFANGATTDVRLAELSALNSHKYDLVDKNQQWQYLARGAGGMSVTDANAMLAQAAKLAGPYRLSITWPAGDTMVGTPYTATVKVISGSGNAVAGSRVSLSGTGVKLAAGSVTTNAAGQAAVGFTILSGTASTFSIAAAVQSWTQVAAYSAPQEQRMLAAAPATTQRASATGQVTRNRDVNLIKVAADDATHTPVPGYVYRILDSSGHVVVPAIMTGSTASAADLGSLRVGQTYTAVELDRPPTGRSTSPSIRRSRSRFRRVPRPGR